MAGKSPAKAEAMGAERVYQYDGETYALDPDLDEVGLMEFYEAGKIIMAAKTLVGDKVYSDLRAAGKLSKMEQLNKLVEAAFKAMGTNEGE